VLAAGLPQLVSYARHVRSDTYPGSAYQPRVEACLAVSRTAAEGGPFATVKEGRRYSVAPVLLSDLGVAGIMDALGRLLGRPVTVRALGVGNLVFLTCAVVALAAAFDPRLRLAAAVALLVEPLSIREYRSPDVVAIHGAFAALAVCAGAFAARSGPTWAGGFIGVLVFALHKLRSVYGSYALGAMVAVALVFWGRAREWRPAARLALALAVFVVLGIPWRALTSARAEDPRVTGGDTLTSHGVYQPLISGIGWSENRWGIKPADPWVATYIAERLGEDIAAIATREGESQARQVYLSLWREAPGHLAGLYARRLPRVLADHFALGRLGAALWSGLLLACLVRAWRRSDPAGAGALLSVAAVIAGLLAQAVLIDPRLIYAYPLRFVSTLGLTSVLAYAFFVFALPSLRSRRAPGAHLSSA
jgi:hypothetical protein